MFDRKIYMEWLDQQQKNSPYTTNQNEKVQSPERFNKIASNSTLDEDPLIRLLKNTVKKIKGSGLKGGTSSGTSSGTSKGGSNEIDNVGISGRGIGADIAANQFASSSQWADKQRELNDRMKTNQQDRTAMVLSRQAERQMAANREREAQRSTLTQR